MAMRISMLLCSAVLALTDGCARAQAQAQAPVPTVEAVVSAKATVRLKTSAPADAPDFICPIVAGVCTVYFFGLDNNDQTCQPGFTFSRLVLTGVSTKTVTIRWVILNDARYQFIQDDATQNPPWYGIDIERNIKLSTEISEPFSRNAPDPQAKARKIYEWQGVATSNNTGDLKTDPGFLARIQRLDGTTCAVVDPGIVNLP